MPERKYSKALTISNLLRRIEKGSLQLRPDYQREEVWTSYQERLLIDSILQDLDIPKIYIRETDDGSPNEVVDGQQRLTACKRFVADGVKILDEADPVRDEKIAGKTFSQLSDDLQDEFLNANLDIVFLNPSFTDEQIEDMFLRLQQGTPLNAAEKRRALPGKMRDVVANLAKNNVFSLCSFSSKRYGFEDAVAKILHQRIAGGITEIRPNSIKNTYLKNKAITDEHKAPKDIAKAFRFLCAAFQDGYNPLFKKFSLITTSILVADMLDQYDLQRHKADFAEAYKDFEAARAANSKKPEDEQEPGWIEYSNAARSDSIAAMEYRYNFLQRFLLSQMPDLRPKDPKRAFSVNEKHALYKIAKGLCATCDRRFPVDQMEADHILEHSKGGETTLDNAQLLCVSCHKTKSATIT